MIPSSGCPPWPPDHPRTLPRTGTPTPPRGARPQALAPGTRSSGAGAPASTCADLAALVRDRGAPRRDHADAAEAARLLGPTPPPTKPEPGWSALCADEPNLCAGVTLADRYQTGRGSLGRA